MRFELRTASGDFALQFDAPAIEGYVLGRTDENSDYKPDIDFTHAGARVNGVSRRHAALVRYQGVMHILDLQSVNGTYLNGKRLAANVPHLFRTGDELRLGTLELRLVQLN